jgi:hypothetical protein
MCPWTEGDHVPEGALLVEGPESGQVDQMVLPRPACNAKDKMCYCMLSEREQCQVAAHLLSGAALPPSPCRKEEGKKFQKECSEEDQNFSPGSIPNAERTQSRRGSGQSTTRHAGRVTNADIYDHIEAQREAVNETDEEKILHQRLKNLSEEREAVRREADSIWQQRSTVSGEEAMSLTKEHEAKMTRLKIMTANEADCKERLERAQQAKHSLSGRRLAGPRQEQFLLGHPAPALPFHRDLLPTFNAAEGEDAEEWERSVRYIAQRHGICGGDLILLLSSKLSAKAKKDMSGFVDASDLTMMSDSEAWLMRFRKIFGRRVGAVAMKQEFLTLRQQEGQSYRVFLSHLLAAYRRGHTDAGELEYNSQAVRAVVLRFMEGMERGPGGQMYSDIRSRFLPAYQEMGKCVRAEQVFDLLMEACDYAQEVNLHLMIDAKGDPLPPPWADKESGVRTKKQATCAACDLEDHGSQTCPRIKAVTELAVRAIALPEEVRDEGLTSAEVEYLVGGGAKVLRPVTDADGRRRCFFCGAEDHLKRECCKWLDTLQGAANRTIEANKGRLRYQDQPVRQPARELPSYADHPTAYQQKVRSPVRGVISRPAKDAATENRVRELQEQKAKINRELATLTRVSKVWDEPAYGYEGQESTDYSKNC